MQPSQDLSHILTHEAEERSQYFQAVAPPIIQSSNFAYDTVDSFRQAMRDELAQPLYTRGANPTVSILRQKLAALEHTEDALVVGSGASAIAVAVMGNVRAGDHVICIQKPYSWTYKLIQNLLGRFGVESTFVDGRDVEAIKAAYRPNTRVLMLESPNSLTFELQDLEACAQWAKSKGVVTIIDNSYCSPIYQNPADFGIDIIVHSGTKYLNGHSDVVCGVICGAKAMIKQLFESEYMTLGTIISPNDAWLMLRGLRTLPIRLERSNDTALTLIEYLQKHPLVERVIHPFSSDFSQLELSHKQMRGAGGLFSVVFRCDDIEKMEKFCNAMTSHFLIAVSWGGYESLQIPTCIFYNDFMPNPILPASFVRYYVGLEDAAYLIEAFERNLPILES